ncbi:sulfite exporter TauE/SafE family protein [Luteimonas sp. MC1825]|nr:sulfite exporter TauE/SafE family protein [Luteimonas sp. MC1782]MBB6598222.1 sulfite exporter TauE/SafE family protein [Luteimonas sp. MC1825]QOC89414.1 sulfite exporter TauE/SafE family protein [Luteimonas sp. MC1825]
MWIFPLLGIVAGVMAGLLGIGGGLVLVAALAWLLPLQGVPADLAMHAALASSMASIVMTSLSSAWSHHRRGGVLWPTVHWMVPGLLAGGWLGSRFAVSLEGDVLRWIVACYCLLAGAQMAFGRARGDDAGAASVVPTGPAMTTAGLGIGALSAVVGIGGGSITVPLLVWRGVRAVRAVGTSSACGFAIAVGSVLGYALNAPEGSALPQGAVGYVYLPAAIGVALTSIIAAPFGTRIAHAISGPALRRIFAAFLVAVGLSLVL